MIVLDASAAIDLLLGTGAHERIEDRILRSKEPLAAPHLLDVEVIHALRRRVRLRELDAIRAGEALDDLADLEIIRYPHTVLIPRAWELRSNLSAFDAMYVALAEALDAALVTADARLARAPGHAARIDVYR